VLVALAIVGLAVPALLFLVKQQLDAQAHYRDKTYAQWVASNQLTEWRLDNRIKREVPAGRRSGEQDMVGRTWYWQSETGETSEPGFYKMEVKVSLDESFDNSLVTLIGYLGVEN
jgi:general secretion pathway protein I